MIKSITLKDSTPITIRPLSSEDIKRSTIFFNELPFEDRKFLRVDVTKPEFARKRIDNLTTQPIDRLIALHHDEIIAEGSLEREDRDWKSHIGEIRLIISKPFQRKGLGMLMARELYFLAVSLKLKEIVAKIMNPQSSAIGIFKRLGFHTQTTIPNYVTDTSGKQHDLIVMRCPLNEIFKELQFYLKDSDWQRSR